MNIVRKTTPHFRQGRSGSTPVAVVVHIAEGSLKSVDGWFANPASKVSAHYCVGKRGEVHQYVVESNTAFHAGTLLKPTAPLVIARGKANPNTYTVGIEHEGAAGDAWTPEMYAASARLIAEVCRRWNIPIDSTHIIPHRAIRADKTCPGYAVDLDALIALAVSASRCAEE